jgi:hypothetical protein
VRVSIEVGISLSEQTHAAVLRALRRDGHTLGEFVDAALRGELARRDATARQPNPESGAQHHERWTRRANGHSILR